MNRNYQIVKMKGWECSVFPPLDPVTGDFIEKPGRYFGNRWEGLVIKKMENVETRFPETMMRKLIEALEFLMESHDDLKPQRRFNIFALHTWIDRETANVMDLESQEFYNRIAFGVCVSQDHHLKGNVYLDILAEDIMDTLYLTFHSN